MRAHYAERSKAARYGVWTAALVTAAAARGAAAQPVASQAAAGAATSGPAPMTWPTDATHLTAAADAANWTLPAKSYSGNRYVTTRQLTPESVPGLRPAWTLTVADSGQFEAAPIVWQGVVYFSTAHAHIYAVDGATGAVKWHTPLHVAGLTGRTFPDASRGVALVDGRVFAATNAGHLVALDAATGSVVWDVVGVSDSTNSYFSMAPVPFAGGVIVCNGGGDDGARGQCIAFSTTDGHRLWVWNTMPAPGTPGYETWTPATWEHGGACVWSGMAIDPATHTLFVAPGNAGPDLIRPVPAIAQLYSNSLVAVDISTSTPRVRWYHQLIKNDTHDADPAMPPVLFRARVGARERSLVAVGDKAGNFFIFDQTTGAMVHHVVVSRQENLNVPTNARGDSVRPNHGGGIEYNGGAYDAATNLFIVPSINEAGFFKTSGALVYTPGQPYLGGKLAARTKGTGLINAIDVSTGAFRWRYPTATPAQGGALITSTGVVFTSEIAGTFYALDVASGRKLWSYDTTLPITAPPSAYTAGGREMVVVASGTAVNSSLPGLPKVTPGNILTAFALPAGAGAGAP